MPGFISRVGVEEGEEKGKQIREKTTSAIGHHRVKQFFSGLQPIR